MRQFLCTLALLLFLAPSAAAQTSNPSYFFLGFDTPRISYLSSSATPFPRVRISVQEHPQQAWTNVDDGKSNTGPGKTWHSIELGSYQVQIRHHSWSHYWHVNTFSQEVYEVTGGTFGALGGNYRLLSLTFLATPQGFDLELSAGYVYYHVASGTKAFIAVDHAGSWSLLSLLEDWNVTRIGGYTFRLRLGLVWWSWQVDTSRLAAHVYCHGTQCGRIYGLVIAG